MKGVRLELKLQAFWVETDEENQIVCIENSFIYLT